MFAFRLTIDRRHLSVIDTLCLPISYSPGSPANAPRFEASDWSTPAAAPLPPAPRLSTCRLTCFRRTSCGDPRLSPHHRSEVTILTVTAVPRRQRLAFAATVWMCACDVGDGASSPQPQRAVCRGQSPSGRRTNSFNVERVLRWKPSSCQSSLELLASRSQCGRQGVSSPTDVVWTPLLVGTLHHLQQHGDSVSPDETPGLPTPAAALPPGDARQEMQPDGLLE